MSTSQAWALDDLRDRILVQLDARSGPLVPALANLAGGAIFPGGLAAEARLLGLTVPVLIDPECYRKDRPAQSSFDSSLDRWLEVQEEGRVAAYLSPSAEVPFGDRRALETVIGEGCEFTLGARRRAHRAPALIELPLSKRWLERDPETVVKVLQEVKEPVALICGGQMNPLETTRSIAGLLMLVSSIPDLVVLRSDMAAVGAVAYGAVFGAIGMGTSTRHFVPGGRGWKARDPTPSIFSRDLLGFPKASLFAVLDDVGMRVCCDCGTCQGRPLSRFRDPIYLDEAACHSVAGWSELATKLASVALDERPSWWHTVCLEAIRFHERMLVRGVMRSPDPYLKAWTSMPSMVSQPS